MLELFIIKYCLIKPHLQFLIFMNSQNYFHIPFEQLSISNTKPSSTLGFKKSMNDSPIKVNLEYEYGQLKVQWDCTNVKCAEGTYFRAIVIIDHESYKNLEEIFQIIEIYYRRLKLGDFMKVFLTNGTLKPTWIEKTSEKLDKNDFHFQNLQSQNLISTVLLGLKSLKKYKEPGVISIFTNKFIIENESIYSKLLSLKKYKKLCYLITIFYQGDFIKQDRKTFRIGDIPHFMYKTPKQLDQKIKIFSQEQNKLRVIEAQIKLKCLTGQVHIRNASLDSWLLDDNTLIKKLYALNNYTKYICSLQVNTFQMEKVGFELQFTVTLIGGDKYKMCQTFYLNIENPAETIQQAQRLMIEELRYYNFSEMPKQLRIEATKLQKIMIKEKVSPQEYLSYQKEFFY